MKPTRPIRPPKVAIYTSRGRSKVAPVAPAMAPEPERKLKRRETVPASDGGPEA